MNVVAATTDERTAAQQSTLLIARNEDETKGPKGRWVTQERATVMTRQKSRRGPGSQPIGPPQGPAIFEWSGFGLGWVSDVELYDDPQRWGVFCYAALLTSCDLLLG